MVWVLTDNRAGHRSQSIGLAQSLAVPFTEKNLHYKTLAALPNGLLGERLWHLRADSRTLITPPWPPLVIAAGRRLVPVMRHIKRHSPHTKLVQLMWPGQLDPFDHIIVPQHDRAPDDPRIIRTLGALHGLTEEQLEAAAHTMSPLWAHLPRPWIAVLIGGGLSKADIARLTDLAELMRDGGSLLLTTSRRTPSFAVPFIEDRVTCPHWVYRWGSAGLNPYHALLGEADALVVTSDSISMLSEACYTGRPVFMYSPEKKLPDKHIQFAQQLADSNYAQFLTPDASHTWRPNARLDERTRVLRHLHDAWQNTNPS
jgi:mitochondrial fission protein ELM1